MPRAPVLIEDDDAFEADYVSAVLKARGIRVIGPASYTFAALGSAGLTGLSAAIVAKGGGQVDRSEIVTRLERAGVPYLTLLRFMPRRTVPGKPILASPFAAYQVADWVIETVGQGSARR